MMWQVGINALLLICIRVIHANQIWDPAKKNPPVLPIRIEIFQSLRRNFGVLEWVSLLLFSIVQIYPVLFHLYAL